jgi:hypothetical protein
MAATDRATQWQNRVPAFLQNVLASPAGALPKEAQWIVAWDGTNNAGNTTNGLPNVITQVGKYEPAGSSWNITAGFNTITQDSFNGSMGCMFAQAVQIPGDSFQAQPDAGIQRNGLTQAYLGQGRNMPSNLIISFLNSNVDFVDNVIRPWVIMTSHLGLVARAGELNYRTDVAFYKLGVTSPKTPPTILLSYHFYGVCPVSVDGHEYTYVGYSSPIRRSASFVYNYYSVDSSQNAFTI